MIVYLIALGFQLILLTFLMFSKHKKSRKMLFAFSILILLPTYLLLVFKGTSVGVDTSVYRDIFEASKNESFFSNSKYEFGFIFYTRIISKIFDNFFIYSFINYTIIFICLFYASWKTSSCPPIALFLMLNLDLISLFSSGLRQALSIGILFLSISFFEKKISFKMLISIMLFLISISFHYSSVFGIVLFIPLIFNKIDTYINPLILVTLCICFLSPSLYSFLYHLLPNFFYTYYPDSSNTFLTLILMILMFCWILFFNFKSISFFEQKIDTKDYINRLVSFSVKEDNNFNTYFYSLLSIISLSFGITGIVFSRLFDTFLPFIAVSFVEKSFSIKSKSIKSVTFFAIIFGSAFFYIVSTLIHDPLNMVPYETFF